MKYINDKNILKRLGVTADMYAIYSSDDIVLNNNIPTDIEDEVYDYEKENIDNSKCNEEFEKVSDGYKGIENYMHGDIKVYKKSKYDKFATLVGTYDITGMYRMESGRGTMGYLGKEGKARCIAIPQCKMMNSTTFDEIAEHKVYVGEYISSANGHKSVRNCGKSGIDWKSEEKRYTWMKQYNFFPKGTHVPFDYWQVIGAIYGKALVVWRGIAKLDWKKMPTYMTVHLSEIYETFMPGSKWDDLSIASKYEWKKNLVEIFKKMNELSMCYDLPDEEGRRIAYIAKSILETSLIERRAIGVNEEKRCLQEWGDVWEPFAVKVHLRGTPIFDFCWRNKTNSPSVVQIRPYDYDIKKIFNGKKGWSRCFAVIYAAWLVQYRNFWKKRGEGFKSCELVWSQYDMIKNFKDSVFEIKHLSTEEMKQILDWYSVKQVFDGDIKRPAHISSCEVIKRCELRWELPRNLNGESVILKDEDGHNISMQEAGIGTLSKEVLLAQSRMDFINEENKKHVATIDGYNINMTESVIYRVKRDKVLNVNYIEDDLNGRCYSMASGIQALKRDERKRLKINGNKVKEVDYKSLHPQMLYALNGLTYQGNDMYDVGRWYLKHGLSADEAKKAVKMMLLRMINAKNINHAVYSFKKGWNEENHNKKDFYIPWIWDLYEAIVKYHKSIAHEFCTGKGTYLMNLDGKLIREVCWRLTKEKICALGIHDSVVVEACYAEKAAQIMREEYEKVFNGFTIKVSYK